MSSLNSHHKKLLAVGLSSCLATAVLLKRREILEIFQKHTNANTIDPNCDFGHSVVKYFDVDEKCVPYYWNSGAFGIIPKYIKEKQDKMHKDIGNNPENWFRKERDNLVYDTLKNLALYLNVKDWTDLIFVDNISFGQSMIFHSIFLKYIHYKNNDNDNDNDSKSNDNDHDNDDNRIKILRFNTAYETIQNTLDFMKNKFNIDEIVFNVTYEMLSNNKLLLNELSKFLNDYNEINFAFISHIPSEICVVFDIKSICSLLKNKYGNNNIITCIDGAHTLGHLNINIENMQNEIDIYVMNGYKWFYAPRGSGLMYINKNVQNNLLQPFIISDRYQRINYKNYEKYGYVGTKDYTNWILMNQALKFRQMIGGDEKIKTYIKNLAIEGGKIIANIWKTKLYISDIDNGKYLCGMVLVEMPKNTKKNWNWKKFGKENNIWIKVFNTMYGHLVARFSVQIIHQIEDFQIIAKKMLIMIDKENEKY